MQANRNRISRPASPGTQDDGLLQLESWLPFRLFTISVRVADLLMAYYTPNFGLSRAAWRTLAIVANRTGASAREICQAGGMDQFAVSRAIASLVELGYAQRKSGKTDRRYASIVLTPKGWNVFQKISDLSKVIDAELTRHVTAEEFAVLDDVLHRLDNASAGMLARGLAGLGSGEPKGTKGRPGADY
jgi:DNA-binding MarR family transcriptional regulator